jgi:hypothetical protein
MGCPHAYYIRALQMLAHALAHEGNPTLAKDLSEETNAERLERYILLKKAVMSDKEFYYAAGGAAQCTINEAYEEGCDPLNASISGIDLFENFIGLEVRDE